MIRKQRRLSPSRSRWMARIAVKRLTLDSVARNAIAVSVAKANKKESK